MSEITLVYDDVIISLDNFFEIKKTETFQDLAGVDANYVITVSFKDNRDDLVLNYNRDSGRRDKDFIRIMAAVNNSEKYIKPHMY